MHAPGVAVAVRYCPRVQSAHVAPYLPAWHSTHDADLGPSVFWPNAHVWQDVCSLSLAKVIVGHARHEPLPGRLWYVPGKHGMHAAWPGSFCEKPGLQLSQASCPGSDANFPTAQRSQVRDPKLPV